MSSKCFEPEGSSSGKRLYPQLWYGTLYMHVKDKPSGSKFAETSKKLKLILYFITVILSCHLTA